MTSERDFDRLARAWLELGPDEAPDRVVAAVLQAAETTPQVRRSIRWLPLKDYKMTRLPVLATVAAALVVAIGGLLLINRPNDGRVGAPTASPSPSAIPSSGSPAAAPLDVALHAARWMGSERTVPGILATAGTIINFTADNQFFITQSNMNQNHFLNSVASGVGDGQFQLETPGTGGGPCSTGDIGRYSWSVAPSGRILTIVATSDDCPTRLGAIPGTWWLEACKNPDTNCLGNLDAGTYKSQYFTPRLDAGAGAAWVPDFGALTYTVPDGWANSIDFPERYGITPAADFAPERESDPHPAVHEIELHWQYAATAQNAACTSEELTSVPRTVNGLVDWIRGLPSLDVGAPAAITIDGHNGRLMDVGVSPSWKSSCPGETQPIALFLTEAGSGPAGDTFSIVAGHRARLVFLDLGDGDLAMVAIYSSDLARFDELVAQSMPIIESFTFK
jgi:hypothetical protein